MKSSGMTEQGSNRIPRKSERPGQKSFESSIAECGLKLMLKSVGTRKEEGP